MARLKQADVLLASRRVAKGGKKSSVSLEEDAWDLQYGLFKAQDIIIADDSNEYQSFGDEIFCCPQEDLLESEEHALIALAGLLTSWQAFIKNLDHVV
jgi:hypothetical protein